LKKRKSEVNIEPAPKSTFSFLSVKVATGQDIIFESYMFRT